MFRSSTIPIHLVRLVCAFLGWCLWGQFWAIPARAEAKNDGWLGRNHAQNLDEAAAILCVRGTDNIIDNDVRRAAQVSDGQVLGLMRVADSAQEADTLLWQQMPALADTMKATHMGSAKAKLSSGKYCSAAVASRRLIELRQPLPHHVHAETTFSIPAVLSPAAAASISTGASAASYTAIPSGTVRRANALLSPTSKNISIAAFTGEAGPHILELLVELRPGDPEIALYWPFVAKGDGIGFSCEPPVDDLLREMKEQSDTDATRQSLRWLDDARSCAQLPTLDRLAWLSTLAKDRADAVAVAGRLGHRIPADESPMDAMRRLHQAGVVDMQSIDRIAEVQAQGGSWDDVWRALWQSPAHRYELLRSDVTHVGIGVSSSVDAANRTVLHVVMVLIRRR